MNKPKIRQAPFLESTRPQIHSHGFAGLLTRSARRAFPITRLSVAKIRRAFFEHTAAGLSGIPTRFPFHPIAPGKGYGTKP